MQLSTILQANAVKSISSCTSKKRLFHDLGELAETSYGLDADTVIEALMDRENLGPTGVGQGIAKKGKPSQHGKTAQESSRCPQQQSADQGPLHKRHLHQSQKS